MIKIQSVLFDRSLWDLDKARRWIKATKGIRVYKYDITHNKLRFRQLSPDLFTRLWSKKLGQGITLVIGTI